MPQCSAESVYWTAQAFPSVVPLTTAPTELADPAFALNVAPLETLQQGGGTERSLEVGGQIYRVLAPATGEGRLAVLIPLDQLFDIRATAALALWRALAGRPVGRDPPPLTYARRHRLIQGLRAVDGKSAGAGYREIAAVLFGPENVPKTGWKTHDLRGRVIRLVHFGLDMTDGGYRRLLLHPYRRQR